MKEVFLVIEEYHTLKTPLNKIKVFGDMKKAIYNAKKRARKYKKIKGYEEYDCRNSPVDKAIWVCFFGIKNIGCIAVKQMKVK